MSDREIRAVGRVKDGKVVPATPGIDYDADLFPPSFREVKRAQSRCKEIILGFIRAYGPVTIPKIQRYGHEQTGLKIYEMNVVITEVLRSTAVELYDVTEDGVAAFWTPEEAS